MIALPAGFILTPPELGQLADWAETWQEYADAEGNREAQTIVANVARLMAHAATLGQMVDELCAEGDHALKGSSCRCGENHL